MQRPPKLLLTLSHDTYDKLEKIAAQKGMTVKELIRREILPEWVDRREALEKKR